MKHPTRRHSACRPTRLCSSLSRLLLVPTALLATAPLAMAQDEKATTLDRITVTGSNIPRATTETASPVQIITRQEIDRTGKATIAEYLQTLTSDGAGSIPKSFGTGFAGGGSGISLRGLGAASTLVLLNGRRMAPYGLADDGQKVFTDLSVIPMDAVERVEVLKDGASAIYGSDAIAGVVNIILRRDFTGAMLKASYGTSGDSDGDARKASLTAGVGNLDEDGFNAFVSIDVSKTDGIRISDRRDRKWIGNGDLSRYGFDRVAGGQFFPLNGAITAGGTVAGNSPVGSIRDPATGLYQSLPGCAQFSRITPVDPGGGCLWETQDFRSLTPSEEFGNLFARGTFALSDNFEMYGEFGYSKKKTEFYNTPNGVSGSWGYPGGPVNASSGSGATVLGAAHPDNPLGVDARLRYAAFDVGPRVTTNTNEFTRFLVGVKGTAGAWDIDTAYLHSATQLVNERRGFLRYSHVRTALTDPNSPVGWWRIGASAGQNTQALYDYISPTIHADASTTLDMIDFKASRSIADLAGGPLGLAFGAEYRRQKANLDPQSYTDLGDIIGLGYSAYKGTQEVAVAYAEMVAPVLESLELSGALRVDKYKGGDTATTPKVGIKWTPADWIAVRATYAEGFRAPGPAEAGDGGLAAFSTARDPVRCPGGTPAPGATAADCAVNLAIITSANPNLKPEESKSYTVGLVLDPTPTTTLTLDAWQIKRTNEINQGDTDLALAAGRGIRSDNDLPGVPNSGSLLAVSVDYINSASTTIRGFDFDIRQRVEMGAYGKLLMDLQWTRINSFERDDGTGTKFQYAGTHGNCDVTNCIGTPKDRFNLGVTWDMDRFSVSAIGNYIGSMDNVAFEGDSCANHYADGSDAPRGCELRSFYTIDLSGRWRATDALEIFGSVQNVTDRIAPLDPLTYGAVNYNPLHFSGAVGRYFTLGAKYTFN
ncbi:TonB-dependent receptor [Stenotrophomonas sp. ATCM1_4]|uniref:TonB-dependent receptor n=1 Tax=unclassified Stenotrophomonas TaxID=196198 RepID=UPI001050F4AD|nr:MULTISPECIES: TonB-dependent receptor [unclassified Stenotrophomonas]MBD9534804.1 TonB-dependent receptor [Stenotrophomonas sp. STM01]TDB29695.1 TonB-dependent receptor [Stenotrophomonas sp. ATCM1_4]